MLRTLATGAIEERAPSGGPEAKPYAQAGVDSIV
jgi:hypothetical protein